MSDQARRHRQWLAMELIGVVLIVAAFAVLVLVDDPLPLWVVLAGGGVMFLGAGAVIRGDSS